MKKIAKKFKLLSFVLALMLCMCSVSTVSAAIDINEDEFSTTINLYGYQEKHFDCYPYIEDADSATLYLRTINYDDAELEITFCDETEQEILETQYTSDYRTTFYFEDLSENHVYRIYISNRSNHNAEVKVSIF